MDSIERTIEIISAGTAQVTPRQDLVKKLESGNKLVVKLGMDPTAPDLHLGHVVVLEKLKTFQELGHIVVFVIGDFTARIGDPTERSQTRPILSLEEIAHNMKTYFDQVGTILDIDNTTIRYNSSWLKDLSIQDFVKLCGSVTLARIIERDDFQKRLKEHKPIGFHELLYPLFQAYDSVALDADIEIGGTDQTFNLLMGRFLQEQLGQDPQVVITMPLLEGTDGVQKMSKSLSNAIGIVEPADQVFGKLMSISDDLMWRYFSLLLGVTSAEISQMQARAASGNSHPMALKKDMAHRIVAKFWSEKQANSARSQFEALFQKKDYSKAESVTFPSEMANPIWIVDLLKNIGSVKSSSEAKRLIESGAVKCDDVTITDFKAQISWQQGMTIKVGKHRIYKIA